jgi:hypothetical protein
MLLSDARPRPGKEDQSGRRIAPRELKKKSLAFAIGAMGFGMERIFAPRARRARERCDARAHPRDALSSRCIASRGVSATPRSMKASSWRRRARKSSVSSSREVSRSTVPTATPPAIA